MVARCHQYALGIKVVTICTVQREPLDCTASTSLIPSTSRAYGAISCTVATPQQDRPVPSRERRSASMPPQRPPLPGQSPAGKTGGQNHAGEMIRGLRRRPAPRTGRRYVTGRGATSSGVPFFILRVPRQITDGANRNCCALESGGSANQAHSAGAPRRDRSSAISVSKANFGARFVCAGGSGRSHAPAVSQLAPIKISRRGTRPDERDI